MTPGDGVRGALVFMRSCRIEGFMNGSTHSTGRHAKMPPKVTLMVRPCTRYRTAPAVTYGEHAYRLGGCRK